MMTPDNCGEYVSIDKDLSNEGILLVNKPVGKSSFSLVAMLRNILGVKKIGHAGTLDPFATGVMVMLIGSKYTRQSNSFLHNDKEYIAKVRLGVTTDTYDCDGVIVKESDLIPTSVAIEETLSRFQGEILQVPPMFSAKKQNGKKLYEIARKGGEVVRQPCVVRVTTTLLSYEYPYLNIHVRCSKGTYIRTIAYDIGELLGCGAHLSELTRTRSGSFRIEECLDGKLLDAPTDMMKVSTEVRRRMLRS